MASFLTYNNITISISKTLRYVQQRLYSPDGSDRIGTKILIEVEGVYSPFATSYGPPLIPGDPVQEQTGFLPATTDNLIREALSTPRCQLLYVSYGIIVVQSPAPGMVVDVANGPTPILWETAKVTERTWHVRFRVETTIAECPTDYSGLMSNRWSQVQRIGEDRLTALMTEGVAIFRMDTLYQIGRNADAFRDLVLPPCPQGFQRKQLEVSVNPIGNVLQYRIYDQERMVNIGDNVYGVVDFEAAVSMNSVTLGSGLSSVASTVVEADFQGVAFGSKGPGYRSGNLLTWLTLLAIDRLNLPVPGNQNAENKNYVIVHVGIHATVESPRVALSIRVRIPPPSNAKKKEGLGPIPALELLSDVRDSELLNPADGSNPQMPFGNNARGYYLGELYAQALRGCLSSCDPPTVPVVLVKENFTPYLYASPGQQIDDSTGDDQSLGGSPGSYSSATTDNGQITYFEVRTKYATDLGTVVAPVAGAGLEPPFTFRLRNPITTRNVQFTGERIGAKPPVPRPVSSDLGEVLVGDPVIAFAPPTPAPDGQSKIYRVSGEFNYVRVDGKSVINPGTGLSMGSVPWATFAFEDEDNTYLESDQQPGITGPNGSGGG